MLRLKDLFKIDFSSKGGGKLADKIFNKYNITKEEREEVKNEIANGGGGGGDSEEFEYYKLGDVQFLNDNQPNYVIKNILLNKYPEIDDFDDSIRDYVAIVAAFSTEFIINFRTGQYNGHSVIGLYFIAVISSDITQGQPMIAYFAIKKNINIITDKYYPNINVISETTNTAYNSIKYVKELESITVKISKEEYDNAIAIAKNTIIK